VSAEQRYGEAAAFIEHDDAGIARFVFREALQVTHGDAGGHDQNPLAVMCKMIAKRLAIAPIDLHTAKCSAEPGLKLAPELFRLNAHDPNSKRRSHDEILLRALRKRCE
jgi:hypothetical protein